MEAKSLVRVVVRKNNRSMTLEREDCVAVLNALIRSNLIEFDVNDIQDVQRYEAVLAHASYAYSECNDAGDERVFVTLDLASEMIAGCLTPAEREKVRAEHEARLAAAKEESSQS